MSEGAGGSSSSAATMVSPSNVADNKVVKFEFHPSLAEEERRFYLKAYPTVDVVRDRKVHCTVCKTHIGTAPIQETGIKMHPILRVTHCMKCHDFYNSGEFSKGEDGSELYCRWCGQGGEVYCCSSCPYVFCKSCIVKNLSKGVVADIEQNENWNCFSCAPKILWPLRAQHWALMNYIEQQKREAYAMNLSETEMNQHLRKDRSKCCRLAKAKCGNMSDSMESLDSVVSKRSHGSAGSAKKPQKHAAAPSPQTPSAKRAKTNDEVVCTPDLLSMLEPDCQITVSQKSNANSNQRPMQSPSATTPRIMSIQQQPNYGGPGGSLNVTSTPKTSAPPPLLLRNTAIKLRPAAQPPIVRRTVIGPRAPAPGGSTTPVYHTINGYRIDLNSAAQQETFRLPNGKLIQVKRQGPPPGTNPVHLSPSANNWQQMPGPHPLPQQTQQRIVPQTIASRPVQITPHPYPGPPNMPQPGQPQVVRYHNNMIGSTTINAIGHNGTPLQAMNGQIQTAPHQMQQQQQMPPGTAIRPVMVRHIFPDTPIGQARTQLQEQVFNAMEICTHLTNKVQTLTNSNAYKQAKNYLEVKELYIHLSYLLTYAVGRFKGLQDKCLADMRHLGFGNDADCLENGQLAAAIDYVCYGQLDDVDLFNTGSNSFHNQVYEYRKSLHANLKDGEDGARSPLPPLFALGQGRPNEISDDENGEDSLLEAPKRDAKGHWMDGDESPAPGYGQENEENEEPDETYLDNDDDDDGFGRSMGGYGGNFGQGTEESMRRNEETHAYDRKLTRLVSQYPSIWCTRHPDYGNFEVTRKQWRTIAAHFERTENIKLRWKNIRKRFVRIEKRIADGKRFNGHFDKAMAFLANRDLPADQWVEVDCGEDDGDTYDRQHLDAIEKSMQRQGKDDRRERELGTGNIYGYQPAVKPIEIDHLDLKIITFVKTNPVLWRKSMDPEADKIDEQTRYTVWNQLHKSLQTVSSEYIRDRWQHLYEMYKTFRLKTIKSDEDRSNLELKYSKYLAKLYFLYKIEEQELRNENNGLFEDCFELEDDEEAAEEAEREAAENARNAPETEGDSGSEEAANNKNTAPPPTTKLQDMPDDKEFLQKLVECVSRFPALWDTKHTDYNDIMIRDNHWQEICENLKEFKHKQASDDEDNEIEIVEPKTDLINLDSDDDEPSTPPTPIKNQKSMPSTPTTTIAQSKIVISPLPKSVPRTPNVSNNNLMTTSGTYVPPAAPAVISPPQLDDDNLDLMSMAQSFLASMLEVDIHEGPQNSPSSSDSPHVKKQPRKKLTNKPNPTLLKQKAIMERERLEEMKRNDQKLKMKCAVNLKKAEVEYPFAKPLLEAKLKEKQKMEMPDEKEKAEGTNCSSGTTMVVNTGKETVEVQLVIEDDPMNSSTEEKKESNGEEDSNTVKKIILIEEEKSPTKNEETQKRKKSVEGNTETTETNKTSENVDEKAEKDISVEILEISDDVSGIKNNSLEIIETSKNSENETSINGVVEADGKDEEQDSKESTTAEPEDGDPMKDDEIEDEQNSATNTTTAKLPENIDEETKMDVDEDGNEESTKDDKSTEVDSSPKAANNKTIEDIEDAEVYKEIEMVLKRKPEEEKVEEKEKEQEEDKEEEKEKEEDQEQDEEKEEEHEEKEEEEKEQNEEEDHNVEKGEEKEEDEEHTSKVATTDIETTTTTENKEVSEMALEEKEISDVSEDLKNKEITLEEEECPKTPETNTHDNGVKVTEKSEEKTLEPAESNSSKLSPTITADNGCTKSTAETASSSSSSSDMIAKEQIPSTALDTPGAGSQEEAAAAAEEIAINGNV